MGPNSCVGDPVPVSCVAIQLGGCGNGRGGRTSRPDDGDGDDREPEKERPKRKALSMEDLRRKYSWWPSGGGEPVALIDMGGAGSEDAPRCVIKSTNL